MNMRVDTVRVPYWRALRPRWVWMIVGGAWGFVVGILIGGTML